MAENLVNFDSSQILLENTVQTNDVARKLKSTHPPGRSPLLHNIASSIKRQLTAGISVKCDIQPLNDQRPCLAEDRECSWNSCPEAQLSADRTFYLLPVNCHIPELPLQCRKALLTVTVRPCSRNLPVWLSSPTKPEASVLDIHDSEGKPVYGKKEEITLRIKHPPVMFCQLQSPGNRHMCGPKCSRKHINKETSPKSKGTCVVHSNLIKDMSWAAQLLPACLLPSEELSLCAELDLTQLPSAFSKEMETKRNVITFCEVYFVRSHVLNWGKADCCEVCKHMKLNLRYLIPGSDNSSLASRNSLASVRSDDLQLLNAPFENLWRSRSGSRSSCGEMTGSRQELKMTTGQKSLSVSDLGPGSVEDMFKVTGSSQRSPMLQKREVQGSNLSPAQYEQLLLNPGNFIKNSCVVKVVCPD
ncbi:hypothetical protein MAR_013090 [Mya arenaria]|uniref:Uncharacterized protein n=1 Tax=Mya arenaria TaxID=6604 RepID=A0ABY7G7Z1_MYAAR|nr:hypothetical protein MAR_013090 [Mya arenaria]